MRALRPWLPAAPLLLYLAAFLVQPTLYAVKLSFTGPGWGFSGANP